MSSWSNTDTSGASGKTQFYMMLNISPMKTTPTKSSKVSQSVQAICIREDSLKVNVKNIPYYTILILSYQTYYICILI